MINRRKLKEKAKQMVSKNYMWVVVVSLIVGVVSGSLRLQTPDTSFLDDFGSSGNIEHTMDDLLEGNWKTQMDNELSDVSRELFGRNDYLIEVMAVFAVIAFVVFIITLIIALIYSAFILIPIVVGCNRWFIMNRTMNPQINEIAHPFTTDYLNVAKTAFFMNLEIVFFSFLFVIPGIIKQYQYRMVPYLLAENPRMNSTEAKERSKKMMQGHKWAAFVLDLSFFGWELLGVFTCGILSLLWVRPYVNCTNAELYVLLCSGGDRYYNEGYGYQDPFVK